MGESVVYVRKLYNQELGYRAGEAGKAGRYFFVSKDFTSFFPPLSKQVKNDFIALKVIPPFPSNPVLCKFVYHNSKHTDHAANGRDEYRLYLNNEVDPDRKYYNLNDIIVIAKMGIQEEDLYKVILFPAIKKGDAYQALEQAIVRHSTGRGEGSHALVPISELPFIENRIVASEPTQLIVPDKVKDDILQTPCDFLSEEMLRHEFQQTRFIRESSFRDLVLYFYEEKCAITGTAISYRSLNNLQACHIIPDSHRGPAHPRNGVAMCQDMHWAFDKGFFTIGNDFTVQVHERVRTVPGLQPFHGKPLFLPRDNRAYPSEMALRYHKDKVFGLFLRFN